MDGYIVLGGLNLGRGGLLRIEDGRGMLLYVWEGGLWVTQERDRRDYFVKAGEWLRLDRDGAAVAYALRGASLTVTAPVPAHFARRVLVGPRVVYDPSAEPGGWLQALRQRFSRAWANAFAPLARPTTAGL